LEFIIEQGHRVNCVSGSLDSRVTGSQNRQFHLSDVQYTTAANRRSADGTMVGYDTSRILAYIGTFATHGVWLGLCDIFFSKSVIIQQLPVRINKIAYNQRKLFLLFGERQKSAAYGSRFWTAILRDATQTISDVDYQ